MPNQFTASLWGDEAFSAVLSKASLPRIIDVSARDTYPPLYNIVEHLWFNLFGSVKDGSFVEPDKLSFDKNMKK